MLRAFRAAVEQVVDVLISEFRVLGGIRWREPLVVRDAVWKGFHYQYFPDKIGACET